MRLLSMFKNASPESHHRRLLVGFSKLRSKSLRNRVYIFIALILVALAPAVANAACVVTNTNDSGTGSLRAAINNNCSAISFQSALTGTITLTSGTLVFNASSTVTGPGATNLAISGGTSSEVFDVTSGNTVTISGLTIENGIANQTPTVISLTVATGIAGGAVWNDGTLTLQNCVITGNSAPTGVGGGIYNSGTGTVTIDHCTVTNNSSGQDTGTRGYGGGLFNAGTATITSSTFSANLAGGGGRGAAIYNVGSATLQNSTIEGNESTDTQNAGGGLGAVYSDGQMTMANCTIYGNIVGGTGTSGGLLQSVANTSSPAFGTAEVVAALPSKTISSPQPTGTIFTDACLGANAFAGGTNATYTVGTAACMRAPPSSSLVTF